jgi:hypothetical protein
MEFITEVLKYDIDLIRSYFIGFGTWVSCLTPWQQFLVTAGTAILSGIVLAFDWLLYLFLLKKISGWFKHKT